MNMSRASSSTSSTISFNPTTSKYYVHFGGTTVETTVTDRAATASQWVQDVTSLYAARGAVVGLNVVYWRSNTTRGVINKAATLQLCVGDRCLILQLFHMDEIPDSVKGFLMNPNFTFVGVEVGDDVQKLRDDYGLDCCRYRDIRETATARWPLRFRWPGLKELALELCGLQMMKPKHVSISNWAIRVLSEEQVEYACIDAFVSYKVGHKLFYCPVCDELVFDSTKQPRILACGHAMHMECYDAMSSQNQYRCPICFKSDMNMSTNWMKNFVCLLISLYIVYIFIR